MKNCIESVLKSIDQDLVKYLKIDTKLAYGIVNRYVNRSERKLTNIVDNIDSPYNGKPASWDDRYQCIWFHRVDQTLIDTSQSDYGNKRFTLIEEHTVATVVWSKKIATWMGEKIYISQLNLYENFSSIINRESLIEFTTIDLDTPAIESQEFFEQGISTESNLVKLNYRIKLTKPLKCEDERCFPNIC